jgi:hypothetical protein
LAGAASSAASMIITEPRQWTAMPVLHFITHPEVIIDPSVPVPHWPLSPQGLRRMSLALKQPWMRGLGAVFSSAERKPRTPPGL